MQVVQERTVKMKKRIIIGITTVLVILAIIVFMNWDMNPIRDIKSEDVQEIMITNPTGNYNVTKQEDIGYILKELQSMKLYKSMKFGNGDGFSFLMNIKLHSGETIGISISNDIRISGKKYRFNYDYIEQVRKLFDELKRQYEWNPA